MCAFTAPFEPQPSVQMAQYNPRKQGIGRGGWVVMQDQVLVTYHSASQLIVHWCRRGRTSFDPIHYPPDRRSFFWYITSAGTPGAHVRRALYITLPRSIQLPQLAQHSIISPTTTRAS